MKSIYYWCPFFSDIATEKAVLNSIIAIKKYSKNQFKPYLINGKYILYILDFKFIGKNELGVLLDKYF